MFVPFIVKAWFSQGVVVDSMFGLTLDGLLSSIVRKRTCNGLPGSLSDGGLGVDEPEEVELPLGKCFLDHSHLDALGNPVWHWMASSGVPMNFSGSRVSVSPPDQHRLLGKLDERRISDTTVSLPKEVGGSRGRFRTKTTPILSVPAAYMSWRGFGDIGEVEECLSSIDAIGARRGSGEGAVVRWEFITVFDSLDVIDFVHKNEDGSLSRPSPATCAEHTNASNWRMGVGGLRPPLFHSARQLSMAIPTLD